MRAYPGRVADGGALVAARPVDALAGAPTADVDRRCASAAPVTRRPGGLAARALLRRLLAEAIGSASAVLAVGPNGRPYLVDHPDVGVSLAHTGGWAAAAVRPGGVVGVDVQPPVPIGDGLVRRCAGGAGYAALSALDRGERELETAWIWSVQEACVKAEGTGLAGRPWTVPVRVGQPAGRWHGLRWRAGRGRWPVPVSWAHRAVRDDDETG